MRRAFLSVTAAIILLGGGVAFTWYMSALSARTEFGKWANALRADGYEVALGEVSVVGFPRTTGAIVEGLEIARPGDGYNWRWNVRRLRITGHPDSERITVQVLGPQQLLYLLAGEKRSAIFGAQKFRMSFQRSAGGRIEQITAELGDFVLRPEDAEEALTARFVKAELMRAAGAGLIPDGSMVRLRINGMVAPQKRTSPLGSNVEEFYADAILHGRIDTLDPSKALPSWREASKANLRIGEVRLLWGLLSLHADGMVALDEQYRPQGRFNVRLQNFVPALDALYAAKRINGGVRADYYAALLPHVQSPELQNFDAILQLKDGNIHLLAEDKGLDRLTLGALTPILQLPR